MPLLDVLAVKCHPQLCGSGRGALLWRQIIAVRDSCLPIMTEHNLILIHRGPEYRQDFHEIRDKIRAIDPELTVLITAHLVERQPPASFWARPTLTVSLAGEFKLRVQRGPVIKSDTIDKIVQARVFREAGLPTPPIQKFQFGAKLDPILFGEFVVIKPMSVEHASFGNGVQLFRRRTLEAMKLSDFPREHLIHKDRRGFLVQRFIDTGPTVNYTRILTFLGEPLYSYMSWSTVPRGRLDQPDVELQKLRIASARAPSRERVLRHEEDAIALARRVHEVFPTVPLLGIDIVREETTRRLFVIECNAGGNVWHFSSKVNAPLRVLFGGGKQVGEETAEQIGRQMHIDQFGAFDRAAEVLVRKTRELAA